MNKSRLRAMVAVAALGSSILVMYVGTYLALVLPESRLVGTKSGLEVIEYRYGGIWAKRIFWPLEKIDRKVRPTAWVNWE